MFDKLDSVFEDEVAAFNAFEDEAEKKASSTKPIWTVSQEVQFKKKIVVFKLNNHHSKLGFGIAQHMLLTE